MQLKTLVIATVLGLSTAFGLQAKDGDQISQILTTGTASMEVEPDMASLSINVNSLNKSAAKAKDEVDSRVVKYFDFLRENGIDKDAMHAANLRINPEYDYQATPPQLLGYRASRSVQVRITALDKLNGLLDGALKKGLNEIQGVDFGLANPEAAQMIVRKKAIEDAKQKASTLAEGFGVKLGQVLRVCYQVQNQCGQQSTAPIAFRAASPMVAKGTEESYEQRTLTLSDQVEVGFGITY